ncbi:hypothetical protein [Caulobacter sp. DWP3-1-3b2]|uniref:hypothetical protein n=1 Tax=Caulobacter sp. DWP3-1-3b2 TaxID=2804643 RepID=UPI003CF39E47
MSAWKTPPADGNALRQACPAIAALTTGPTVRDIEFELIRHMSRTQARILISRAKEEAALTKTAKQGSVGLGRESTPGAARTASRA